MSKRLTITYDTRLCIGNKQCERLAPFYFRVIDGKVTVAGATKHHDVFTHSQTFSYDHAKKIIASAHACPVNAIHIRDEDLKKELINNTLTHDKEFQSMSASYDDTKEFVIDPAGYFLIRTNDAEQTIEVLFCKKKNVVSLRIVGKTPIEIYHTFLNTLAIPIRKDHAAYLGRELQKAYASLQQHMPYVQDENLQ